MKLFFSIIALLTVLLLGLAPHAALANVTVTVSPSAVTLSRGQSQTWTATYTTSNCENPGTATYQWAKDGVNVPAPDGTQSSYTTSFCTAGNHTVKCTVTVPNCGSGQGTSNVTVVDSCFWEPFTPIQCLGIATVTSGGNTLYDGTNHPSSTPSCPATYGQVLTFTAAAATDQDKQVTLDANCNRVESIVNDTTSYSWTASGGTPASGNGQTFTWTAPNTAGSVTITLKVDDGKDTNKGTCNGSRADSQLTFTFTVWVAATAHAHPTNFKQTQGGLDPNDPTVLYFQYTWDSTSGDVNDLGNCKVGEIVTYPGNANPYIPPNPPVVTTYPNPTIGDQDATRGTFPFGDHHYCPVTTKPYSNVSYSGTQYYRFHCSICMAAGQYQNLMGPNIITRYVELFDFATGTWRYRITKSGQTAIKILQ